MLMLHDWLSTACRVTLGPFEGVFVGGSGDTDCGDRRDRARPCEGFADDEVAVAFRAGNNVLFGNAHVVEYERIVLAEAMAHRVDDLLNAEARRASWHHDCTQTLLAALRLVRPDDAYVDVGALCLSHPPALHGQYLRPFSTYSPFISSAVRPMPTGDGCGASKFAVPPGRPPASLTTQPARYSPFASVQAGRSHFSFSASVPNQTTFIRPRPLTRMVVAKPGSTAQISSATSWRSRLLTLPPPYSLGRNPMANPRL